MESVLLEYSAKYQLSRIVNSMIADDLVMQGSHSIFISHTQEALFYVIVHI